MKRTILSIENTYFEPYETIGFCMGGSLTLVDNNKASLEHKLLSDADFGYDNDMFCVTADLLKNTDQHKEEFFRWNRDNKSAEVEAFYLRPNGSVTVIRYALTT